MTLYSILLQAAPAAGAPGAQSPSALPTLIMIVLMIVVFYFFMIRPQMKKAKVEKNFKEQIVKGDKIVTLGGIHGKIVEVAERTFIIEVEGGNRLKIEKSAISMEATRSLAVAAGVTPAK